MSDERPWPADDREQRLHIGQQARALVRAAALHDAMGFVTLADEVMVESFTGVVIAPEGDVPGPSYLQAFLAYAMRVSAAMIREALDDDEQAIEDLLTRVCTALEIGDDSF